jgi:5-bromo-4-chloroindolyl phosphate hydrolysis protein
MKLNKLGAGVVLVTIFTGSTFAMEMMATGTIMKDDMMKTGAVIMDKKIDDKMMKKEMMMEDTDYMMIKSNSGRTEVTKLQKMLAEKGYLKMPKGVAYGYYGKLTKAAFTKYSDSKMMMKATDTMMKTN